MTLARPLAAISNWGKINHSFSKYLSNQTCNANENKDLNVTKCRMNITKPYQKKPWKDKIVN